MSLVTGESAPVRAQTGAEIYAGVLNIADQVTMRATARVEDSLVADVTRLIEAGEQARGRYVRLADRAAALYVPLVHGLALTALIGWLLVGAPLRDAVLNAVAVLIITCPCALGLAAPAVFVVATGRLFKAGVLVKSGDALERLAEATHAVFDKTGTLTVGKPRLVNRADIPQDTLIQAAALARISRHPLARALVAEAGPGAAAADAVETPGAGVEARIDGRLARLGRCDWVCETAPTSEHTAMEMWFQLDGGAPVRFDFTDRLRHDAAETVSGLVARGFGVEMLSGDREGPARETARAAGIERWFAGARPVDKVERLQDCTKAGVRTLMIGDGLNDAPALASAHVSMSPASAADASQAAADMTLQGADLAPVLEAVDVARAARRRVLENFAFAALYNAVAVPLAVFGFVTPLIAALAMSGSSVVVTLNALRLARRGEAAA